MYKLTDLLIGTGVQGSEFRGSQDSRWKNRELVSTGPSLYIRYHYDHNLHNNLCCTHKTSSYVCPEVHSPVIRLSITPIESFGLVNWTCWMGWMGRIAGVCAGYRFSFWCLGWCLTVEREMRHNSVTLLSYMYLLLLSNHCLDQGQPTCIQLSVTIRIFEYQ